MFGATAGAMSDGCGCVHSLSVRWARFGERETAFEVNELLYVRFSLLHTIPSITFCFLEHIVDEL